MRNDVYKLGFGDARSEGLLISFSGRKSRFSLLLLLEISCCGFVHFLWNELRESLPPSDRQQETPGTFGRTDVNAGYPYEVFLGLSKLIPGKYHILILEAKYSLLQRRRAVFKIE
jgi:hypothetical protein